MQWANEELAAMVREAAARQAQIERRLKEFNRSQRSREAVEPTGR